MIRQEKNFFIYLDVFIAILMLNNISIIYTLCKKTNDPISLLSMVSIFSMNAILQSLLLGAQISYSQLERC